MIMALLLPWFPIILAVGVGARLLGAGRGLFFGCLCALFWIVLVQTFVGVRVWHDPWSVMTLISGSVAIAAMGVWAAQSGVTGAPFGTALTERRKSEGLADGSIGLTDDGVADAGAVSRDVLGTLVDGLVAFDDWLDEHRFDPDPWPKFDEFLRRFLHETCGATHVRPFRISISGSAAGPERSARFVDGFDKHGEQKTFDAAQAPPREELIPLCEADPLEPSAPQPARRGVVGHVVATGRSFVRGDQLAGELIAQLAAESVDPPAWCFAIRHGPRRSGAVVVGRLGVEAAQNRRLLAALERMVQLFWLTVMETDRSRTARHLDPVSSVQTRPAFLDSAERALHDSYAGGEPVAVAVIALEGLREINDSGRWELGDELMRACADFLRRKLRTDDRIGRFDGSRFVLLLRRVDSQLAALIVSQIVRRLTTMLARLSESACEPSRSRLTSNDQMTDAKGCGPSDSKARATRRVSDAGESATERRAERPIPGAGPAAPLRARCGLAGSGADRPELRTLITRALGQCRTAREQDRDVASDLDEDYDAAHQTGGAERVTAAREPCETAPRG